MSNKPTREEKIIYVLFVIMVATLATLIMYADSFGRLIK